MVHDCTAIAAGFGEPEMKKMINRAIHYKGIDYFRKLYFFFEMKHLRVELL